MNCNRCQQAEKRNEELWNMIQRMLASIENTHGKEKAEEARQQFQTKRDTPYLQLVTTGK